jgi:aminoglycoside 6-adenylyltransferase
MFQDYDVVFVVEETASFIREKNWVRVFGDLLMLQEPDKNDRLDVNGDFDRSYTYLMLFADGNRLDLRLQTKEAMREEYGKDKLAVPQMDKDGFLPSVPLRQSTTS